MAGAQQGRPHPAPQARQVDDGGFDTDLGRAALQHQQTVRAQFRELRTHVLGARGRYLAELIGRWPRHPALAVRLERSKTPQQRLGHGMRGAAQADAVLAAADGGRHMRGTRQDQGQRPWPESLYQGARLRRNLAGPVGEIGLGRHVHNHRMIGGPALGGVDARNGLGVFSIAAQAIHGLGRKGHQAALGQPPGGGVQGPAHVGIAMRHDRRGCARPRPPRLPSGAPHREWARPH